MLVERNHGLPSRRGYAPRASNASTTMMMDNLRKRPRGHTERVSAIRNQKGQFSHEVMPKLLQVALMMTFTMEPSSTTHLVISVTCTRTLIVGFYWSITVGLWLGSSKRLGMTLCGICSLDSIACQNRDTRFRSSIYGQSARGSQIGSMSDAVTASIVAATTSWRILLTFAALALATHSWATFRISSCSSHSTVFALLRVVTYCTSAVMMLTVGCLPFCLWGHCVGDRCFKYPFCFGASDRAWARHATAEICCACTDVPSVPKVLPV